MPFAVILFHVQVRFYNLTVPFVLMVLVFTALLVSSSLASIYTYQHSKHSRWLYLPLFVYFNISAFTVVAGWLLFFEETFG
jgi:hypothetical protein